MISAYFYEKCFVKQIYLYGFHFYKLNNLEFIFLMFDSNLIQNDNLFIYEGSNVMCILAE